jgi:hypothetical protein
VPLHVPRQFLRAREKARALSKHALDFARNLRRERITTGFQEIDTFELLVTATIVLFIKVLEGSSVVLSPVSSESGKNVTGQ